MFYGLLNIDVLANVLPFEGELDNGTYQEKVDYLKSKAVALTCADWARVFASCHATIQPAPGRAIKTFGIVLDGEQ